MKWFNKWFSNRVLEKNAIESPQLVRAERQLDSNGMHFTVHRASGGYVIETRKYDRRKDENNQALHIITDDKDLGEEIGKIITFESLRS